MQEPGRRLIAQMLKDQQVGSGPTAETHAVLPVIDQVVHMLGTGMLGTGLPGHVTLGVEADAAARQLAVRMAPLEIQQILIQLVRNACEAHDDSPGTVAVAVDHCHGEAQACQTCERPICGAHVRLQVRDSGAGMDAPTLARVFEPFFTTKDASRHAGLGLTIVQALTHQAGGHLRVSSAPRQGSTIEVLLPRASDANASDTSASDTSAHEANAPDTGNTVDAAPPRRVWVVSEDIPAALHVTELLRAEGLDVRSFNDVDACLRQFSATPDAVDVVLIDHGAVRPTGPALVRALRALRPDLLCVLCTCHGQPDQTQLAEAAGAQVLLSKPFSVNQLLHAMQRAAVASSQSLA